MAEAKPLGVRPSWLRFAQSSIPSWESTLSIWGLCTGSRNMTAEFMYA